MQKITLNIPLWIRLLTLVVSGGLLLSSCSRPNRLEPGAFSGKNVLLISIDTCRPDYLEPYGSDRARTPNLLELAARGAVFDDAVTPVPLTLPSHTTIMTGLHPIQHGVRDNFNGVLSDQAVTLAELFHEAGYETSAVVGAILLSRRTGIAQGFNSYDDLFEMRDFQAVEPVIERKGDRVVDSALRWLTDYQSRASGKPFFLFVHFYDAHMFYQPPAPFDVEYQESPYAGELAFVDYCIGQLLDAIQSKGYDDDTLIVALGDHGESLGEHREETHGLFLYESTVHVPLIVRPPATRAGWHGRRIASSVSLEDVAPTLIDLCGLGPIRTHGISLLPLLRGDQPAEPRMITLETQYPVTYNWSPLFALRFDGEKYVHAPHPEYYDLTQDPHETKNLVETDSAHADQLNRLLEEQLLELTRTASFTPELQMSSQRSEALASLGYVGGGEVREATSEMDRPDPKDCVAIYNQIDRGLVALARSNVSEALNLFRGALALDPQNPAVLLNLGQTYARMKDYDQAVSYVKKAIEAAPANEMIKLNLAKILMMADRYSEAEEILRAFVERFPSQADAYYQLGVIALKKDRPSEAREWFERARRWMPDIPGLDEAMKQVESASKTN
ncbi:MAG: sulfatase-like hydrolase/transferase [bacterium]|nr:sulfatase-like hydrolase/transferase [bacterium]